MKQVSLTITFLILSILSFSQSQTQNQTQPQPQNPTGEDHIKITAANDSLTVRLKNRSLKLNKIQDLDSCLKNNSPELTLPVIDLESYSDLTSQNHRAIIIILDKYRFPVASEKTISNGKPKVAISFKQ